MSTYCSACGQALPKPLPSAQLTPMQKKIVETVQRAGPEGVSSGDLYDYLYEGRNKPAGGKKSLYSSVRALNIQLNRFGSMVCAKAGCRPGNYVYISLHADDK
jgi:hypothetical protein